MRPLSNGPSNKTENLGPLDKAIAANKIHKRYQSDPIPYYDREWETPTLNYSSDKMKEVIKLLHPEEQDMLELIYKNGMYQEDIGKFFGRTQGGISHRLVKINRKLKFYLGLEKYPYRLDKLTEWFSVRVPSVYRYTVNTEPEKLFQMLTTFYTNYSQTETAKTLGIRQCQVHEKLKKCKKHLVYYLPESQPEIDYYEFVIKNYIFVGGSMSNLRVKNSTKPKEVVI